MRLAGQPADHLRVLHPPQRAHPLGYVPINTYIFSPHCFATTPRLSLWDMPVWDGRSDLTIQGYLAHMKTPTPLGLPWYPRHRPTVGS